LILEISFFPFLNNITKVIRGEIEIIMKINSNIYFFLSVKTMIKFTIFLGVYKNVQHRSSSIKPRRITWIPYAWDETPPTWAAIQTLFGRCHWSQTKNFHRPEGWRTPIINRKIFNICFAFLKLFNMQNMCQTINTKNTAKTFTICT